MAAAAFTLQILTADDYDAVRSSLDVTLDASALPDAVIESPAYGPAAESEVIARDSSALTYESGAGADSVKWARVRRAALLLTAARLCGALPVITSEQVGSDRYSRVAWDGKTREAELRALAAVELAAYQEPDGVVQPLPMFWTAPGYRGR